MGSFQHEKLIKYVVQSVYSWVPSRVVGSEQQVATEPQQEHQSMPDILMEVMTTTNQKMLSQEYHCKDPFNNVFIPI